MTKLLRADLCADGVRSSIVPLACSPLGCPGPKLHVDRTRIRPLVRAASKARRVMGHQCRGGPKGTTMAESDRTTSEDTGFSGAIAHALRQIVEAEGHTGAIFGSPLKVETRTVIPVAMIEMGGGVGGGFGQGAAGKSAPGLIQKAKRLVARGGGGGGGGGLTLRVRPVGYLCEENGQVVYRSISVS